MRVKVEINIDYDDATIKDKLQLKKALEDEISQEILEGLLTPTLEEVIDDYSFSVSIDPLPTYRPGPWCK